LKVALERLLGGRCYHKVEVFQRPEDMAVWERAAHGEMPDWKRFLDGYTAAVDWPASAFWPEIAEAFPDALILLSWRDAESWWKSASRTIFEVSGRRGPDDPQQRMVEAMMNSRFTADYRQREAAMAAHDRWNDDVRRRAPKQRLLEWRAGDGWEPICRALGLDVPNEPFPLTNTSEEFRARIGLAP
jgi:hypothetical protein